MNEVKAIQLQNALKVDLFLRVGEQVDNRTKTNPFHRHDVLNKIALENGKRLIGLL